MHMDPLHPPPGEENNAHNAAVDFARRCACTHLLLAMTLLAAMSMFMRYEAVNPSSCSSQRYLAWACMDTGRACGEQ